MHSVFWMRLRGVCVMFVCICVFNLQLSIFYQNSIQATSFCVRLYARRLMCLCKCSQAKSKETFCFFIEQFKQKPIISHSRTVASLHHTPNPMQTHTYRGLSTNIFHSIFFFKAFGFGVCECVRNAPSWSRQMRKIWKRYKRCLHKHNTHIHPKVAYNGARNAIQ